MTLSIELAPREGALERLLSTCRRRGLALRSLQADVREDGGLRLSISLETGTTPERRVLALLLRIVDIERVEVLGFGVRAA